MMADLPPPYSVSDIQQQGLIESQDSSFAPARYVGFVRSAVSAQMPIPVCSIAEDYSHRHDVYLSTIASLDKSPESTFQKDGSRLSINTVHFCTPDLPSATFAPILGDVDPELFSSIQGFRHSGSFVFSNDENQISLIANKRQYVNEQLIRHLIDVVKSDDLVDHLTLGQAGDSGEAGHSMAHFYKVHMFSRSAEFVDATMDEAFHLLFKWAKPQSVYGPLSGFWEHDLIDVVNDGVLRAGGQLILLVRSVSDQQMEDLRTRWQQGTHIQEF